jgi:hypothetical protein
MFWIPPHIPPGLTLRNPTYYPHCAFMCVDWFSEQTVIISCTKSNWTVLIPQLEDVYCAVRPERLNIVKTNFEVLIWSEVASVVQWLACWLVVSKIAGSLPPEAVGFFGRKKSSACLPSEGEVKPFVLCRKFAACKRSLNGVKRRHFGKITGPFSPTVPPFATRSARVDGTGRHLAAKSGNV